MGTFTYKQLGELLQEKQEPFILDIYLLEKGCSRNRFSSDPNIRCCSLNTKDLLKASLRLGVNKKSKVFPNCSKVVKAVFGKIALVSKRHKVKKDHISIEHEISSSFPESDVENSPNSFQEKEVGTKKKLQLGYTEDSKDLKLSPVSVLDEAVSCLSSPANENGKQIPLSKDSIHTVPVFKFTLQLPLNEPNTDFPSQYSSTEKVLHQSKQLLFDCVRELLESNKWKLRKENNLFSCLGADEINKLLCDDIRVWSKLKGKVRNITRLLKVDFGESIKEWSNLDQQRIEISKEIGDAIFDDISSEIIEEMASICSIRNIKRNPT